MHVSPRFAVPALVVALAFGGVAAAQEQTTGVHPNDVWQGDDFVNHNPVWAATLGLGGAGNFTGTLDPKTNELCYLMNVPGLDDVTAAHIHVGGPDEDGKPVIPLETPKDGASGACTVIAADLAKAIDANPGGYYVNVHTKLVPGGAVRGQLHGWDGYAKVG